MPGHGMVAGPVRSFCNKTGFTMVQIHVAASDQALSGALSLAALATPLEAGRLR